MPTPRLVQFLGVADYFQPAAQPFPIGGVDLFQLAQHKLHVVYPGIISNNVWVLLISAEFLKTADLTKWVIRIVHEDGREIGNSTTHQISPVTDVVPTGGADQSPIGTHQNVVRKEGSQGGTLAINQVRTEVFFPNDAEFALFPINFQNSIVNEPGKVTVQSIYDGVVEEIGSVHFHYRRTPSFTSDQIKAIEADPGSARVVHMEIACKFCPSKLNIYIGLQRSSKLEKRGEIWYADLPDEFVCSCGKVRNSLRYLRESAHGMLLLDLSVAKTGISYARQYSHGQLKNLSNDFVTLLDSTLIEQPVQEFLEKNPVLLARFNAKRLFIKPAFLGKHFADFAIIDNQRIFWLIEIEKPSLKLFRERDGHPTADLMHAYNQVVDWMHQYQKHAAAVRESLGLKEEDVVSIRGVVAAGRSTDISHNTLARHLLNRPYPNIEFMTLDDLATSMVNLSSKLA